MQFKRKLDPKKGRSQSSGEDVVWFSSIRAFFYLLSSPSLVLYICDALLLILFVVCVVIVIVVVFFFFVFFFSRWKYLLSRLVQLWRRK